MLSVAAADDEFLYGSSPGTDTDGGGGGMASTVHPQGTARVWATGFQEQEQVCQVFTPYLRQVLEV